MNATEKQKTAILNLDAYFHTLDKTAHRKATIKRVKKISLEDASKEIGKLIKDVKKLDKERKERLKDDMVFNWDLWG